MNAIFTSVGFGQGCDLIKLVPHDADISFEKIFSNKSIQSRNGGMVLVDGHVYGYSGSRGWFCMEMTTGKITWSDRDHLGRGSILAADGLLYCCTENGGTVALLDANPAVRTELSRFTLPQESEKRPPSGGLWTHPVIANKRLYIRDQQYLYCYDVGKP